MGLWIYRARLNLSRARQPRFVSCGIVAKSRPDQHIPPVGLRPAHCFLQLVQLSLAEFQDRETDSLHALRAGIPAERQVVSALVAKDGPYQFLLRRQKQEIDALLRRWAERRCSHIANYSVPVSSLTPPGLEGLSLSRQ